REDTGPPPVNGLPGAPRRGWIGPQPVGRGRKESGMRGAWRAARRARPGLSLMELLMAIALTGVLFAFLLPPLPMGPARVWHRSGYGDPSFDRNETALAERGFIGVQL